MAGKISNQKGGHLKVLLIDADSKIPNIPLMKLSAWHKGRFDEVHLIKVGLPYYPNLKKSIFIAPSGYDVVYCSVIFEGNKEYIKGGDITFGGTGVDLTTKLPPDVESCLPDYSIYPENDTSYGFITRGCIRKCSFCKVPEKEGRIHRVSHPRDIIKHKRVKFLDNNILAHPSSDEVLGYLAASRVKCQFTQGLDIRLLDSRKSDLLSRLNYIGSYTFAFDNWGDREVLSKKLDLLFWRKPYQIKFFVYVHPGNPLAETVKRIMWLKERECLPYIMRDIQCWGSEYSDFFTDIAAYCNQVHIFKKMGFGDFLSRRYRNGDRASRSSQLWAGNS